MAVDITAASSLQLCIMLFGLTLLASPAGIVMMPELTLTEHVTWFMAVGWAELKLHEAVAELGLYCAAVYNVDADRCPTAGFFVIPRTDMLRMNFLRCSRMNFAVLHPLSNTC